MHQWNVWHGTQEKYQIFDTLGGRFNSEFGMEAFPHIDTIRYFCTDPTQLYPQSHMIDFHNKADGHERRIATYLVENFRTKTDLEVSNLRLVRSSDHSLTITGIHSLDPAVPGRSADVRLPRLEATMGAGALLWRCPCVAAERLLACHIMVHR
jgi:hypothetical protein